MTRRAYLLLSLAVVPFVGWALWCVAHGDRRWELGFMLVGIPLMAFAHPASRKLFWGIYPLGLLGIVYDAMRYVQNAGIRPEDVHICDLRTAEIGLFGIQMNGAQTTVHDWFQAHATTTLDVLCSIPYGTFAWVALAFAVYLYVKDYQVLKRFTWTLFLLNIAGFVTYHIYPAAPPWYYHAYGCNADLLAHASEGPNLARVDQLLGFHYFNGFYGRSHDVFGAIPSLHVAYPLLVAIFGWRYFGPWLRVAIVAFTATMAFGAVYLDHHWIIDVILGVIYTFVMWSAVRWSWRVPAPQLAPAIRT